MHELERKLLLSAILANGMNMHSVVIPLFVRIAELNLVAPQTSGFHELDVGRRDKTPP